MADQMTYVICEPCADVCDRACVAECPVDCIYEGLTAIAERGWWTRAVLGNAGVAIRAALLAGPASSPRAAEFHADS